MSVAPGQYGKRKRVDVDTLPSSSPKKKQKTGVKKKKDVLSGKNKEKAEFTSTAESLKIVGEFHTLNKRIEQTKNDPYLSEEAKEEKIAELEKERERMGGLEKYQRASMFGADTGQNASFNASKWVLQELTSRGYCPEVDTSSVLTMLDVGAINNQYLNCSKWLDITPIDLHPQHPSVVKADFFDYAKEYIANDEHKAFDFVILSLVINFVGDIKKRGEMIALCAHPELLKKDGLLFIVLPSACLQNSRYMKYSRFVALFSSLGFTLLSHKLSKKLVFWIFQLKETKEHYNTTTKEFLFPQEFPKKLVRGGTTCNNFTILLSNKPHGDV